MFSSLVSGRPAAEASARAGRILVIDDNHDLADMLEMLLSSHGYVVRTAYGGGSGLKLAEAFRPDIILCDLGMPGVDGYDVAKAVRGRSDLNDTALVAVSAWDDPLTLDKVTSVGFDSHLVKPVNYTSLTTVLNSHLCKLGVSNLS